MKQAKETKIKRGQPLRFPITELEKGFVAAMHGYYNAAQKYDLYMSICALPAEQREYWLSLLTPYYKAILQARFSQPNMKRCELCGTDSVFVSDAGAFGLWEGCLRCTNLRKIKGAELDALTTITQERIQKNDNMNKPPIKAIRTRGYAPRLQGEGSL